MNFDSDAIATGVLALVVLGIFGFLFWIAASNDRKNPVERMFFGQQFHESDLKGTTGKVHKLAIACDLTTTIVPDLLADGFVPHETSTISDVEDKVYVMTFWRRLDMRIVTETDSEGLTCIISVSNNVKPLQSEPHSTPSDGESRDNLDGAVPL